MNLQDALRKSDALSIGMVRDTTSGLSLTASRFKFLGTVLKRFLRNFLTLSRICSGYKPGQPNKRVSLVFGSLFF